MKRRFIIYRRKLGGGYYIEDTKTRKQESLGTFSRNIQLNVFYVFSIAAVYSPRRAARLHLAR